MATQVLPLSQLSAQPPSSASPPVSAAPPEQTSSEIIPLSSLSASPPQPISKDDFNAHGVSGSFDQPRPITVTNAILHPVDTLQNGAAVLQLNADYRRQQNLKAIAHGKPAPYSETMNTILSAGADTEKMGAVPFSSVKNLATTAALMTPGLDIPAGAYLMFQGGKDLLKGRQPNENHADYVQRALTDLATVAGGAAATGKGIGEVGPAVKSLQTANTAHLEGLQGAAGRVRDAAAAEIKANINNTVQKAYDYAGQQVEKINAADEADRQAHGPFKAGIETASVEKAIDDAENIYRVVGQKMPGVDTAIVKLQELRAFRRISFEQAKQLRGLLYNAKSMLGNQGGVIATGYKAISDLMKRRAESLGLGQEYEQYHDIYNVLKEGDPDKTIGPILDKINHLDNGSDLFDLFRNQKYKVQIEKLEDSLAEYGLPKNIAENAGKDYGRIQQMIEQYGKNNNFMGILKSVVKHPVRSIPTYLAGHAAGGFVGGYVALGAMNDIAERLELARELKKFPTVDRRSLFKQFPAKGASIGEQLESKGKEPLQPEEFAPKNLGAAAANPATLEINGSGESDASLEALHSGQKFRIINERSGAVRPVSAVDARGSMRTNPNEHIEVFDNGHWTRYR